ncbi:uncharacterized protein LOC130678437 [Microplitis mediator]|uniref:uncharacterized protein LOC130678437 n=1 Tax=Microplitis mediator TaxID=375433 RepID=UPI002555CD9E|nr:uncharacterized protein LOC130678437 [Microplitis mediator]
MESYFTINQRFTKSWEFFQILKSYEDNEKFQLFTSNSKYLKSMDLSRYPKCNQNLIYDEIYLKCTYGGLQKSKGCDVLPRLSQKTGCKAKIEVRTSADKDYLYITDLCYEHNHSPLQVFNQRLVKKRCVQCEESLLSIETHDDSTIQELRRQKIMILGKRLENHFLNCSEEDYKAKEESFEKLLSLFDNGSYTPVWAMEPMSISQLLSNLPDYSNSEESEDIYLSNNNDDNNEYIVQDITSKENNIIISIQDSVDKNVNKNNMSINEPPLNFKGFEFKAQETSQNKLVQMEKIIEEMAAKSPIQPILIPSGKSDVELHSKLPVNPKNLIILDTNKKVRSCGRPKRYA